MLPWDELSIIGLALALGGLMKGVTGVGLPLITVPVMAGFVGVERAVLIMVIPSAVLNAYQIWSHRDASDSVPEIPRLLLAGAFGAALGATVLHYASERFLATSLAVWILSYIVFRFVHPSFALSMPTRMRASPAVGLAAGALQAATGISAPVIAAYMDALKLSPRAYVFAVCAPFGAFAGAHCLFLIAIGAYTPEIAVPSIIAIAPALAFIPVGVWLRRHITPQRFDLVVRLTLLAMAARLLYTAWLD